MSSRFLTKGRDSRWNMGSFCVHIYFTQDVHHTFVGKCSSKGHLSNRIGCSWAPHPPTYEIATEEDMDDRELNSQ